MLVAHIPLFIAGRLPSVTQISLIALLDVLRLDILGKGNDPMKAGPNSD